METLGRYLPGILASLLVGCGVAPGPTEPSGARAGETKVQGGRWNIEAFPYGAGNGKIVSGFVGPYGLALDHGGELFVADLKEGRVVRFDAQLKATGWLGARAGDPFDISGWHVTGEPERGRFIGAYSMAHSISFDRDGGIYVADYGTGRVYRYGADGSFLGSINDPPSEPNLRFQGVANAQFDADFNLWVSDFDAHRVFKFDPQGKLVGWIGAGTDGIPRAGFSTEGASGASAALGGFNKPHMVAVDEAGNIYVVETGNHRVQKFSPQGRTLGWIGGKADGSVTNGWEAESSPIATGRPGGFDAPVSIRLVDNSYFIISDNGNHRIQRFSIGGRFLGWLGGKPDGSVTQGWASGGTSAKGSQPGAFSAPYDAWLQDGRLFVADGHNARVQVLVLDDQ